MTNLYYRLARCFAVVDRHQGASRETIENQCYKNHIPETTRYKIKNYFDKMVYDGVIYEKESDQWHTTPTGDSE